MLEVGIDISSRKPRQVAPLFSEPFHYVVSLCDATGERYPAYPFTANLLKWSVPDPEVVEGEPDAARQAFRQVREQMRSQVEELVQTMNQPGKAFGAAA
jgi:protein-tyrosine-phosphatase